MSSKITPTKSNLLKTKDNLKLAQQGRDLLEQKKEVLMIEFMAQVNALKNVSANFSSELNKVRGMLKDGMIMLGEKKFEDILSLSKAKLEINIIEKSVMSVNLPNINLEFDMTEKPLSLFDSNHYINQSAQKMRKLIPQIIKWAEIYISIKRLAEEIKKNNRRVNALGNIFIPEYKDTIKDITDTLDEQEKEEFFRMKKVKKKLNLKKEGSYG